MNIAGISESVVKIYEAPVDKWNRQCKLLKDDEITTCVSAIIAHPQKIKSKTWDFAALFLAELHIRKWGKKHTKELAVFRDAICEQSGKCYLDTGYSIEGAGLSEKSVKKGGSKNKIVRPYPYDKTALKVVKKWQKSGSKKSLDAYVDSYVSSKEKKTLQQHSVTYLTADQHSKYMVTFDKGHIKIGGQTPKDGRYIFALGGKGKKVSLLAGEKVPGKFQHSSFFAGAPVKCPGNFDVKSGQMTKVTLQSGHYKPLEKHGKILRTFLSRPENLGPKKAESLKIQTYKN